MRWILRVLLAVAFTSSPALARPWPGGSHPDSVRFLILADEHVLAAESARRLVAGVEDDPGASNAQRVEALLLWTEACIGMRPKLESERIAALDRLREIEASGSLTAGQYAEWLRLLARDAQRQWKYERAVELLARAESTLIASGEVVSTRIALVLRQRSRALHAIGRHAEAEAGLRRAIEILGATAGRDDYRAWDCLEYLPRVLMAQGRVGESLRLQMEVLPRIRETFGPLSLRTASAWIWAASVEGEINRYDRSLPYARDAMAIVEARREDATPLQKANALNVLAWSLKDNGLYMEAESLFVLAAETEARSGEAPDRAGLYPLHGQLVLLVETGRLAEADSLARILLPRALRSVGNGVRMTPWVMLAAAEAALGIGDVPRAKSLLASAEKAPHVQAESWLLAHQRWIRGWAHWLDGDATASFNDAEVHVEITRRDVLEQAFLLTELDALSYRRGRRDGLEILLLGLHTPGADSSHLARGFDALVRARSLVFDAAVAGRVRRWHSNPNGSAPGLDSLAAISARSAAFALSSSAAEGRAPAAEGREALYEALIELGLTQPGLATLGGELSQRGADVLERLGSNEALLSFVRHEHRLDALGSGRDRLARESRYSAFVVEGATRAIRFVEVGPAVVVDSFVAEWRGALLSPGSGPSGADLDARMERVSRASHRLRELTLDSVFPDWRKADVVHLVPDGTLTLVPFDVLEEDAGALLVEGRTRIRTWAKERDLVPSRQAEHRGKRMLALGDPDFERAVLSPSPFAEEAPAASVAIAEAVQEEEPVFRAFDTGACDVLRDRRFPRLPQTQGEVEDGVRAARRAGFAAGKLLGPQASEASFREWAPGCSYLHIASHGFFLGQSCGSTDLGPESALLRSGFVLAGANSSQGLVLDGLLTAEEIAELDFRGLRTVVLSACESGLGVGDSGEGVLGMRRAFHLAGAQSVVASLWPVRDDAARRWMRVFHARYFSGEEDAADAAREATRSMIAAARADGRVVDPLGVGGFVVTSRGVPR